jgi:hypothetical protein
MKLFGSLNFCNLESDRISTISSFVLDWSIFHIIILIRTRLLPQDSPFRKHAFIKRHAYCIHLIDRAVEMSLKVSMSTKRLANVSGAPIFRMQLDGLEVQYVLCKVYGAGMNKQ